MKESAWHGLLEQAWALLAHEKEDFQLLVLIGALLIVALMLQGVSSLVPRNARASDMRVIAPRQRKASADPAPSPWKPQRLMPVKRKVASLAVRRAQTPRPRITRTGRPGYLVESQPMAPPAPIETAESPTGIGTLRTL